MKRIIISCAALLLTAAMLFGCSAYSNPSKYIKMPEKGAVEIDRADIDKEIDEAIEDLIDGATKEEYVELEDENAEVQLGDKVSIYYTGTPVDANLGLTESELSSMTNVGKDVHELVIGSGEFIGAYKSGTDDTSKDHDGFEDQLIGAKKTKEGDEKIKITVTFPDVYSSNTKLQGQEVVFEITIEAIARNLVSDKSVVTVEYSFENPYAEEETEEETEEDADEAPETEDGETEGDSLREKFDSAFKDGEFEIDYRSLADEKGTFNDLFNIADYADLFKGLAIYHEVEKTVTVPESDDEDYTPFKDAEIKVTFKIAEVLTVPDLTDELIAEETDETYTTVADYKTYLYDAILSEHAYDAITEAAVVTTYPKKELTDSYKSYVDSLVYNKLYSVNSSKPYVSNYTPAELKEILTDEVYAEIYAQAMESARAAVKDRLVLEYLLDYYGITLSNKEYKEKLAKYYEENALLLSAYYGITSESLLETYFGKDNLKVQFMSEELNEKIAEYVTVKE